MGTPTVGDRIRIPPRAIGTAENYVGEVVPVTAVTRTIFDRDTVVWFNAYNDESDASYEAPLLDGEWEIAEVSA